MGAWGTAIFSDDEAADIKQEYQALVAFGIPNEEAFALTKKYFEVKDDDTVFWLAIAAIQQKYGILLPEVKDRALEIIENGEDLAIWEESADKKDYEKRKQVLQKLRTSLLAEPLPKRRVPKPKVYKNPWDVGDVLYGKLNNRGDTSDWFCGKYVLYRVVEIEMSAMSHIMPDLVHDKWAWCLQYDWVGDEIPPPEKVLELKYYFRNPELVGRGVKDYYGFPINERLECGYKVFTVTDYPPLEKVSLYFKDEDFELPRGFEYGYAYMCVHGNLHGNPNQRQHFIDIYEKYKKWGE
ncbi:hypothetical protein FACS189499_03380 [Clostridia bacterium]|nr:hypothetical protein FACS189499_03380 [Clostridia bacterium]